MPIYSPIATGALTSKLPAPKALELVPVILFEKLSKRLLKPNTRAIEVKPRIHVAVGGPIRINTHQYRSIHKAFSPWQLPVNVFKIQHDDAPLFKKLV